MRIWALAKKRGQKRVLILEDDAVFPRPDAFTHIVSRALEEVPDTYDILLLGCSNLCEPDRKDRTALQYVMRNLIIPSASLNTSNFRSKHVYQPEFFGGTHAYIVSERGLDKLLSTIQKVDDHIDWQIASNHRAINIYAVTPPIAFQDTMMDSSTASYGFPASINHMLSVFRDQHNIEYAYYMNVAYARIGSLKRNVQLNAWHTMFFLCGVLGLPWGVMLLFAVLDMMWDRPRTYIDPMAKLGAYVAGLTIVKGMVWIKCTTKK